MASEQLQELESFVGSKHQKQEEIVKTTLGSLYGGEIAIMDLIHGSYSILFSRFRHRA